MSHYSIDVLKKVFQIIDEITPQNIQKLAMRYLTKPSTTTVKANKEVLDANKEYLSNIGEIIEA